MRDIKPIQLDSETQEKLTLIVESIQKTIPNSQVYLFGSYAYGIPSANSDLDIYVVTPDTSKRKLDWCIAAQLSLPLSVHIPVDIIVNYTADFEQRRKRTVTFEHTIYTKGLRIA